MIGSVSVAGHSMSVGQQGYTIAIFFHGVSEISGGLNGTRKVYAFLVINGMGGIQQIQVYGFSDYLVKVG